MPLNILIVGAGVCGPTFAHLLQTSNPGHKITVVERFPALRAAGQQIDLKNQGVPIMRKMGVWDAIKARSVAETGLEMVDSNGRVLSYFGLDDTGRGKQGFTSEVEIMRGDLVRVLYDASLNQRNELGERGLGREGGLTYEFGKTVTELVQGSEKGSEGVDVTFSDGQKSRYDLVVGADGQASRTRRLAFGQEANEEAFKSLGIHAAFYSVPRIAGEGETGKAYIASGQRGVMTRTGDRPVTQAYLFTMSNTERLKQLALERKPVQAQKEVWAETFKNAGWQCDRLVSGLSTCDDFYACELAQIKTKQLYKGRVVLLGDAGYCPSVLTGQGTTASIIGSYILAGELARRSGDVDGALKAYDEVVRVPIDECQKLPFGKIYWPSSRPAVWFLNKAMWAMSTFKVDKMIQWMVPEDEGKGKGGWTIPDYPELNLLP